MKYESMKEVSHGFCKKYKILQYKIGICYDHGEYFR